MRRTDSDLILFCQDHGRPAVCFNLCICTATLCMCTGMMPLYDAPTCTDMGRPFDSYLLLLLPITMEINK